MREILIHPAFNARYYSLYILGLQRYAGAGRLRYTASGFPDFGSDCLAVRAAGESERRIYIHSNDMPELDAEGLAWCHVFGKVNLDPKLVPERYRSRVVALGPSFAVRVWGPARAEFRGVANFLRCRDVEGGWRRHLGDYRGQYRSRFPEEQYRPAPARPDYIFYNAALWEREREANELRARFIDGARSVDGITFEGGLTPRKSARGSNDFRAPGFESYFSRRYSPREHLERTRASAVAMNNPAYRHCHSWRLAEYLALGKAIISTPIVRALPAPLVHGTHVHLVDGSVAGFRDAIRRICGDPAYRRKLEQNARAYYETYLSPASVIRRLLEHGEPDAAPGAATGRGKVETPESMPYAPAKLRA